MRGYDEQSRRHLDLQFRKAVNVPRPRQVTDRFSTKATRGKNVHVHSKHSQCFAKSTVRSCFIPNRKRENTPLVVRPRLRRENTWTKVRCLVPRYDHDDENNEIIQVYKTCSTGNEHKKCSETTILLFFVMTIENSPALRKIRPSYSQTFNTCHSSNRKHPAAQ